MTFRRVLLLSLCLAISAGCAPKTRYSWNGYDEKLYQHYKTPANNEEFVKQLEEIIVIGEKSGNVPPGIYAEYGFALYEKGNFSEAGRYFSLESNNWQESRVLMAKMISNAEMRAKQKNHSSSDPATASDSTKQSAATASEEKGVSK